MRLASFSVTGLFSPPGGQGWYQMGLWPARVHPRRSKCAKSFSTKIRKCEVPVAPARKWAMEGPCD